MKKYLSLVCVAVIVVLSMSSCASYTKNSALMGVKGNSINTYVAADLDYNGAKKVEGVIDTETFLGIPLIRNGKKLLESTTNYGHLTKAQKQALFRAKESGKVDIILDPVFETEKHSYFFGAYKKRRVKVTGWGVNVKGIKEDTHGRANGVVEVSSGLFK